MTTNRLAPQLCKNIFNKWNYSIIKNTVHTVSTAIKQETTLDRAEVDKHEKQTNVWWDPNGPMKSLHSFNEIRIPFVRDGLVQGKPRVAKPLQDLKILDVGCGGGILTEGLARLGASVTGVDASAELIQEASAHSKHNSRLEGNIPEYYCSTIEEFAPKYAAHYDAVVASEIIEHVTNKELFVSACLCALKPGGRIYFTTPNRTRLSQLFVVTVAECVGAVPRGTHDADKFITPNQLAHMLEKNNCQVELVNGIWYNILNNKFSWVDNTQLLYALRALKHY